MRPGMMANTSEVHLSPNSVRSLFIYPFARRTTEEKICVKELGPNKFLQELVQAQVVAGKVVE